MSLLRVSRFRDLQTTEIYHRLSQILYTFGWSRDLVFTVHYVVLVLMPALRYQFRSFVLKSRFVRLQNTKLVRQTEVTFLTAVVVGGGCGDDGEFCTLVIISVAKRKLMIVKSTSGKTLHLL